MDNHKQVVKLCGVCGNVRVYNDYHRIYNSRNVCVAKISGRYYQAKRNKIIAKSKLHQENTKKRENLIHNKQKILTIK